MDGKYEYSIINVHVDNVKKIQNKTFEKNGSLQQILDLSCDGSHIIVGDMNTEIKNGLKDFRLLRNSLSDAALPLGNTYKPLNLALDHILYSDSDLSVNEVKTYENAGSDHSLILANMSEDEVIYMFHNSWDIVLKDEMEKQYFKYIKEFVQRRKVI